MHHDKSSTIPTDVLAVLSEGRCDGNKFYLPQKTLDRKLYESVNKVLDALGGKWNKGSKAHVFSEDCEPLVENAIETRSYVRPGDMGWFPTPPELAERLAEMAHISEGGYVLEPSAGEGALCRAILGYTGAVVGYEINEKRAHACTSKAAVAPHIMDFLAVEPRAEFDQVVMNPPFAKRADVKHVLHAIKFLKPGGRLVSIMSAGILFRTDALTTSLRDQLSHYEELPADSFKASGTSVRTAVVVYDKP